jgi:hypothetical protein
VRYNGRGLPVVIETTADRQILIASSYLTFSHDGSYLLSFLLETRYSSGGVNYSVISVEDSYSINGSTVQLREERELIATGTLNADRSTVRVEFGGSELTYVLND